MDVSGNDLLGHWVDDPGVSSFALYLESIGNPIKFLEIASKAALCVGEWAQSLCST